MWFYMKYIVKIEGDEYLCPWTVRLSGLELVTILSGC
jgi:hypothetical protein